MQRVKPRSRRRRKKKALSRRTGFSEAVVDFKLASSDSPRRAAALALLRKLTTPSPASLEFLSTQPSSNGRRLQARAARSAPLGILPRRRDGPGRSPGEGPAGTQGRPQLGLLLRHAQQGLEKVRQVMILERREGAENGDENRDGELFSFSVDRERERAERR